MVSFVTLVFKMSPYYSIVNNDGNIWLSPNAGYFARVYHSNEIANKRIMVDDQSIKAAKSFAEGKHCI